MVYSTLETESSIALPTDCRRIAGEPECMVRRIGHEAPAWDPRSAGQLSSRTAAVCGQLRTTDGGNVFISPCPSRPRKWKWPPRT